MEWKEVRLGDLCSKIGSGATPSGGKEAYKGGDYHLVRSQNVLDFSFSKDGLASINEAQAKQLKNVELLMGDVLLNITGDSVARACIVPLEILPARVNQHVSIIRPDATQLNNDYLLYYLQYSKKHLLLLASGGATRQAITKGMLEEFQIKLPSLSDQRRIASILSSLDRKIELNNKINAQLEEMAQAIFKSWFVDFEPFKDGKFFESELGMIPEGWRVGTLSEICSYSKNKIEVTKLNLRNYYSTENLLPNRHGAEPAASIPTVTQVTRCDCHDVLISNIRPYFKKIIRVSNVCGCSNDVLCFKANKPLFNAYMYRIVNDDKFFDYIMAGAKGTKMPRGDKQQIMKYLVIVPDIKTLDSFSNLVEPIFNKLETTRNESLRLSQLRDTLLPKLMSGEIETI